MGHGGMDHGGHGGHGDMDMGQCNMNMLFTWSTKNLCIIFPQWRVTGPFSLFVSLVVIVLLTAGYEGVRRITRRYEAGHVQRLSGVGVSTSTEIADECASTTATAGLDDPDESSPLLVGRDPRRVAERRGRIALAALYAVQVFYSFFIMLLFMTYNGLVMLAVAVGAFVGHLAFGQDESATKSVACH
ncbi:low-affinity Cu transporter [Aspergillus glaucus CBS 516.65]|uniref:Copper transport protein n=1 Tax=Aspergillus glaucus CBS 516.65 TaxID=1160497 RepID=A0A1L9V7L9_ASPGL|nr:hypothetical protein ASPGLDRAFT_135953 [Aspergillus glaucus CBS 516.65]OJJ79859.1 hypothetical protein ASPGLDRAFT_135953 [Aspergillus glaucus CBS 516.65]